MNNGDTVTVKLLNGAEYEFEYDEDCHCLACGFKGMWFIPDGCDWGAGCPNYCTSCGATFWHDGHFQRVDDPDYGDTLKHTQEFLNQEIKKLNRKGVDDERTATQQ